MPVSVRLGVLFLLCLWPKTFGQNPHITTTTEGGVDNPFRRGIFNPIHQIEITTTTEEGGIDNFKGLWILRIIAEGNSADWSPTLKWADDHHHSLVIMEFVARGGSKDGLNDCLFEFQFFCWNLKEASESICKAAQIGNDDCQKLYENLDILINGNYEYSLPGSCSDPVEYNSSYLIDDIPVDYERWWREAGPNRTATRRVDVHASDDINLLTSLLCTPAFKHAQTIEQFVSQDILEERLKAIQECERAMRSKIEDEISNFSLPLHPPPMLIDRVSQRPLKFTVIGDSHTAIFNWMNLKVKNDVNITGVAGASMYGLSKANSTTGSNTIFSRVMSERSSIRNESDDMHVLVISLGWCDVTHVSWFRANKYGVNTSMASEWHQKTATDVLESWLLKNAEVINRYDKIVFMGVVPPILERADLSPGRVADKQENIPKEAITQATVNINRALRKCCSSCYTDKRCFFLNLNDELLDGHGSVKRIYKQLLYHDPHILPETGYGLLIRRLRKEIDAVWEGAVTDGNNNDTILNYR